MSARQVDILVQLGFGLLTLAMYLALPRQGDIWWPDASRHAMNGAFVHDFVRAMPLHDPVGFAYDYYRQWPALTILFYPPLFYAFIALSYALFGVSEAAALVPELLAMYLLALGCYRLSRRWMDQLPSMAVAVLIIGAPEVLFWGQQVMLDVPAFAFIIWAAYFHLKYLHDHRPLALAFAVICAVGAMYTKYNAAFFVGVMGLSLLMQVGPHVLARKAVILAALLGLVLLAPLIVIFTKFGSYNLAQAASVAEAEGGRWSLVALSFYLVNLPSVLSWVSVILAGLYALAALFRRNLRLGRIDATFLLIWLGVGFAFYSLIAVKDPRHILFAVYPIVLAAVLVIDRSVANPALRRVACVALAIGVLAQSAVARPPVYVTGMREAAVEIGALAPHDVNIAFWGRLDGTFVYALRAYTNRPDLGVVRLDKILLSDVAVMFERGYTDNGLTPEQIVQKMSDLHVQYVVAQTNYEPQIKAVHNLEIALHSDAFVEVSRIAMHTNAKLSYISELVIYRLKETVPPGRVAPAMDLSIVGKSL
jgi:hypothetical protein